MEGTHLTQGQDVLLLAARQVQVLLVVGEQQAGLRGYQCGILQVVEAVRPGPAVQPAVPLAIHVFTHLPGKPNVVGQQSSIGLRPLAPALHVAQDPAPVLVVAGE